MNSENEDEMSDFIWDDDTVNNIIESSSLEPEYTAAISSPIPPPLPPPRVRHDDCDGEGIGRAVYTCVDPYQGRTSVDNLASPLVRLKGMNKNKRYDVDFDFDFHISKFY